MARKRQPLTNRPATKRSPPPDRFVVISGCSGGGKSTLLDALAARGHATVPEPGRRIVAEEQASGGTALPWIDSEAFARRAIAMARADLDRAARHDGRVFFDRSLIDAMSALAHLTGEPLGTLPPLYHRRVFVTPPWPEIYTTDPERQHGLSEAIAEYDRLVRDYPALGYEIIEIPRAHIEARADFVLDMLASRQ
jgi:predicted ATPase